ncbi:MAG TPA: DUF4350 domain-containing protein [Steroidobacteraceae bacterium]|nr:DUF4350 domain-containing protein [Steroidobacteraceae bacterium]
MRERLQALGFAIGALVLFYILFLPKPATEPAGTAPPLSSESGPDGYLAVWRWLGEQHVPVLSLRYRYDRLPGLLARPSGNLLLLSMPQRVPVRAAELTDLENWVDRGNTLLVMAALDDAPLWTFYSDPLLAERIGRITGLVVVPAKGSRLDLTTAAPDRLQIEPRGAQPLLTGVRQVIALSSALARRWTVRAADDLTPLELAMRTDGGGSALWLERRGAGQIMLLAVATPFSNAAVGLGDNARLLANIISWSRAPGGAVIFDDAHQGATAFYDGGAFFADPRLHRTLIWIVLLWLAFVLGAQPLRAAGRAQSLLDEAAYVQASANYLAAVVRPSDAARRLIEDFLDALRSRLGLEHEVSVWHWLGEQAGVSAAECRALQAAYASSCAGERIDLVRLQNLLAQIRRNLQ